MKQLALAKNFSEKEEKVFSEISGLAQQYGASKVILFGSRARRTHHPKSDIDLAVYDCTNFRDFSFSVDEKTMTLLQFDIVNMNADISEELRKEIERDGIIIYEKI
ncbi:MAG TPA: nucleotidyltransferase [Selenomonas sp.]|nr:nucleotidyltransferase [Selenomonas sp.]